tara:strand:- start:11 stop:358 length:348 start_codon:yes stop_codon:yes gene_type:complete
MQAGEMVSNIEMIQWNKQLEDELIILLKDWLKQKGRTQAELGQTLKASSTRMPAIIEELKKDFSQGGIPGVANHLCEIELLWSKKEDIMTSVEIKSDPLGQLDLLLEEIKEDCES